MKTRILLLLMLLSNAVLYAQRDTEFWFVAPEVSQDNASLDRPIILRLSSYALPCTVTISQPAQPPLTSNLTPTPIVIAANSTVSFDLSSFIATIENTPANTVNNFGLRITGTAEFSAYYDVFGGGLPGGCSGCNSEIFSLKGRNALGTDFYVPLHAHNNATGYIPMPSSGFDIVATENNTTVTITPNEDIVGHLAADGAFTITLHRGQTFSCIATSQSANSLTSESRVQANRPIAVTSKDDMVEILSGDDLIGDQLIPVRLLGDEYIAASVSQNDILTIIATDANTTVNIESPTNPSFFNQVLQAGESVDVPIGSTTEEAFFITATAPVYVYHIVGRAGEAGAAILPPLNCTGSREVSVVRGSAEPLSYILTTRTGNETFFNTNTSLPGTGFTINGTAFQPVPGTTGNWVYAIIDPTLAEVPLGAVVNIENTQGVFHLGMLNGNLVWGPGGTGNSTYGFFSDFSSLALATTNIGCGENCTGEISVDAFGDMLSTSYTYTWSNGALTSSLSNLCEGLYTVTVESDNGCTAEASAYISATDVSAATLAQSGCVGEGTATLSVTGLVDPDDYTFIWSNGATTPSISGISAGSYSVTVTDANGCSVVRSTIARVFTVVMSTVFDGMMNCNGACNGELSVSPHHGGVAPYVYQWNMDGVPFANTNAITNLCVGVYTVTVKDANGCTATASNTLSDPAPVITTTVTDATCEENDGSVTLTVSGLTLFGFSYTWSNGATTSSLTNVGPGTYTVTVTSSFGCASTATATVGGPAPLVGNISLSQNPICVGEEGYMHLFLEGEGFAQFTNDGVVDAIFPYSGTVNHYEPIGTRPDEIGVHEICLTLYSANPEETNDYCSKTICITGELKNCGCDKLEGNAEIEAVPGIDMKYEFSNVGWVTATYINWFVDGVLIEQTTGEGIFSHQFTQGHHTVCMDAAYVLTNEDGTTTCCVVRDCIDIDVDLCEYLQSTNAISYTLDPFDYHTAIFTFGGSNTPTVPTIVWDFGDGTVEVSNGQSTVSHTYLNNNNGLGYQVCATVIWTKAGTVFDPNADDLEVCCCVDEICIPVEIDPCAAVTFNIVPVADLGQSSIYQVIHTAPISQANYTWSANNINLSSGPNVYYNYDHSLGNTLCVEVEYLTAFRTEPPVSCVVEICREFNPLQALSKESDLLRYYPNPTNGMLIVEIEANESDVAKLELTSNIGERLLTKEYEKMREGVNQLLLDISELPSGLYLMKATISNKVEMVKVIKE